MARYPIVHLLGGLISGLEESSTEFCLDWCFEDWCYLSPVNAFGELQVHSFFNFWATNDGRSYTEEQALFCQDEIRLLILALPSLLLSPNTTDFSENWLSFEALCMCVRVSMMLI